MFDETNGSQKEQVDLNLVDDEEAPCDTLQRMEIDDVRPQDPNDQPQKLTPNDTTPPTQGLDQDNHEEDDESNDQDQEESNDQGGDEGDGDKGEAPLHPRVHLSYPVLRKRERSLHTCAQDVQITRMATIDKQMQCYK
jgi:hypothetical protein